MVSVLILKLTNLTEPSNFESEASNLLRSGVYMLGQVIIHFAKRPIKINIFNLHKEIITQ